MAHVEESLVDVHFECDGDQPVLKWHIEFDNNDAELAADLSLFKELLSVDYLLECMGIEVSIMDLDCAATIKRTNEREALINLLRQESGTRR